MSLFSYNINYMEKFIKEQFISFLFGLASTAIGVLIALLINAKVEQLNDHKAFLGLIKALEVEIISNKVILDNSFLPNYNDRIVYRKFNFELSSNLLTNKNFLAEAPKEVIDNLMSYTLELKRSNEFCLANTNYLYNPELNKKWGDSLRISWGKNLRNCKKAISDLKILLKNCK